MTDGEDDILARVIDIAMKLNSPTAADGSSFPQSVSWPINSASSARLCGRVVTVSGSADGCRRRQSRKAGMDLALPNSRFLQFYFGVALSLGFISIDQYPERHGNDWSKKWQEPPRSGQQC